MTTTIKTKTQNVHVKEFVPLPTPRALKADLPISLASEVTVADSRDRIIRILNLEDPRLLAIIGPCSIHNERGAYEYALRLNELRDQLADRMEIVMRVYFEKPRTTVGWKGLINDPHLDGSQDIGAGLAKARKILLRITDLGMPTATEFLDPIVPQYIADLISWAAIGARTTESQTHREMASGLSMPVGMKNGTDGSLQTAIDAVRATRSSHSFLGINEDGVTSIVRTSGNPNIHIVLRGGRKSTNYDAGHILEAEQKLAAENLPQVLVVDCSHANSEKQHSKQEGVWQNVVQQRMAGTRSIIGLMAESNLREGSQPFPKDPKQAAYDVSLTDACMGWETTERLLRVTYDSLPRRT